MKRNTWIMAVTAAIGITGAVLINQSGAQPSRQPVPLFEPDPLWSQALPNKWVTGQVGGNAVDSHDDVWIFHRPATIPDAIRPDCSRRPQNPVSV